MSLITSLCWDHLSQKESHGIPLTHLQGQLIQYTINDISKSICLNPNMALQVKVLKNQTFSEYLF